MLFGYVVPAIPDYTHIKETPTLFKRIHTLKE
jgi:hypothetical protein